MAEQAYERIKEKLISAEYVPGQFLQEATICGALKLGRTPVHQALHRLHQEGLVEIIARKGILVRADSLTEIFLSLEVRELVEPYCAMQCADKATQEDLQRIRSVLYRYEKRAKKGRRADLMDLDREFHSLIADIAGNKLLVDFLRPVHERMSRMWNLPHWQKHDFGLTGDEHEAVYTAIERHDGKAAGKAMKAHIDSLRRRIMAAGT